MLFITSFIPLKPSTSKNQFKTAFKGFKRLLGHWYCYAAITCSKKLVMVRIERNLSKNAFNSFFSTLLYFRHITTIITLLLRFLERTLSMEFFLNMAYNLFFVSTRIQIISVNVITDISRH